MTTTKLFYTGFIVTGLLFIYLMMNGPMSIQTDVRIEPPWMNQASVSTNTNMPNHPWQDDENDGRWYSNKRYNDGTTSPLEHVKKQHSFNSQSGGKSKFLKMRDTKLRSIGNETYQKGEWFFDEIDDIWRVTYNYKEVIGTNLNGEATSIVKMIVDKMGRIKTFHPA